MGNATRAMTGAHFKDRQGTRPEADFYPTPPHATRALFNRERLVREFRGSILEPAAGRGDMARVIREEASQCRTLATDLINYSGAEGVDHAEIDFLRDNQHHDSTPWNAIITNPPYDLAEEFIKRSLDLVAVPDGRVCMLLRMQFLEGQRRRKRLFANHMPSRIWAFSKRVTMWRNGENLGGTSTIFFAWFVWDMAVPPNQSIQVNFAD